MTDDGYDGTATLRIGDDNLAVEVRLRGHFQPIDGHFHWYGRIAADPAVADAAGGRKARATLTTPHGQAEGAVSDPDTWGRYRIAGTGTPPFPVSGA
ncbi:MAG: DUF4873 domain-containing protein [Micromonosporaceae bacterium]